MSNTRQSGELTYQEFLKSRTRDAVSFGFNPIWTPDYLFDFQAHLSQWNIITGRSATFADCGLGKSIMELVFCENGIRKNNKPALLVSPLAVAHQLEQEATKFGIDAKVSRTGKPHGNITITNYEQLKKFNRHDFGTMACDESGILKNYSGKTRCGVIDFMRDIPYRMLGTATPSPNDYTELGNSVEALGLMRRVGMLSTFFVHDSGDTGKWRLKGHGKTPFWRYVASWARAIRKPSDLGFDDSKFILPELQMTQHILPSEPMPGWMFPVAVLSLQEQTAERRQSIVKRCEKVAEIANAEDSPFVAWCTLNPEGTLLAEMMSDSREICGSQSDDEKVELIRAFVNGEFKRLATKGSICGHGMNWQHCYRTSLFPSHSQEDFYQIIRRFWRFGQTHPVQCHIVTTEAESAVLENLMRKEKAAEVMFSEIVANMREFYSGAPTTYAPQIPMEVPSWL